MMDLEANLNQDKAIETYRYVLADLIEYIYAFVWSILKKANPQWMKSMFYDLLDEEDVTAVSALPIQ